MDEAREPASPVTVVAIAGLVLLVLPLFLVQALGLVGVVASANGLGRFVPGFDDVDGDGTREVTLGCSLDPCYACVWHDFGPVHIGSTDSINLCEHW